MTCWRGGVSCLLVSVKTDSPLSSSAVIVIRPRQGWERGWGHVKYMTPAVGWGHARLAARQTPGGKPPWCGISIAAGPRRSKVAEMTAKSALRASPGLRGRRVFLIEPQRSGESLILISGDRNPIFRGDSWESGSPCVREMTVSP